MTFIEAMYPYPMARGSDVSWLDCTTSLVSSFRNPATT